MKQIKAIAKDLKNGLSYILPGFEKTGSQLFNHLLHIDVMSGKKGDETITYLVLTARGRYIIGRYAIKLDSSKIKIPEDTKFTAIIDFERFVKYVFSVNDGLDITLRLKDKDEVLQCLSGKGRYRFASEDTSFPVEMPKTEVLGKLPFVDFYNLMTQIRTFTIADKNNIEGDIVHLDYNKEFSRLTATIYQDHVAAVYHITIDDENMKEFSVFLKSSLFKKVSNRKDTLYLLNSGEDDVFGMRIPSGSLLVTTLNDVEEVGFNVMDNIQDIERPYYVKFDKTLLADTLARVALFADDTVLLEVKNDKAIFKARNAQTIDAEETIACEHKGEMNLEVSVHTMLTLLKAVTATDIQFNLDEEGSTALVNGSIRNIQFEVLLSTQGLDAESIKDSETEEESEEFEEFTPAVPAVEVPIESESEDEFAFNAEEFASEEEEPEMAFDSKIEYNLVSDSSDEDIDDFDISDAAMVGSEDTAEYSEIEDDFEMPDISEEEYTDTSAEEFEDEFTIDVNEKSADSDA